MRESSIWASCPYLRLPVQIRPEWTNVPLSNDHQMTIRLIGDQILYSQPQGFSTVPTVNATTLLVEGIVSRCVPADLPFVWVSDYSELTGISTAARKLFASTISGWARLRGMVVFGSSPFILAAIRIATRLKLISFPVVTVRSYSEALEAAASLLKSLPSSERLAPNWQAVVSDERWKLDLNGYSIRFEVINSSVLHSVQAGRIKEEHLDPIFELRDEVMKTSGLKGRPFSILAGMQAVESSDHAGRLGYVQRMARWYQENPFDVEVFYGLNPLMNTVINLSGRLAPFNVHVSSTFEEGLQYINDYVAGHIAGNQSPAVPISEADSATGGVPQAKIEELLKVLGAISWDTEGDTSLETVGPSDPLALVYDAIRLVKTEIDELLLQQERDAADRRQLQERLAQAEKMEALGLLAGGVAHDLNNILSGIVSYPELLLTDPTLNLQHRRAIETIKKSGDQAAAVVKDLMAISRGAARKVEPVCLGAVVREYLDSPEFEAKSAEFPDVTITSRFDDEPTVVIGSQVNLRQVVANLIANAFESMENGTAGGRVEVETLTRNLRGGSTDPVDSRPAGKYVVLRVADSGSGISEEHREKVFEPFFSRKTLGRSGTGLGLTVVWNTVQSHGGFIDLKSDEEGTRFDVFFPASSDIASSTVDRNSVESLRGDGQSVLVVDDVAVQREIAVALLAELGYRAESVASGEYAIDRLRNEEFDVVLLDMEMEPGLNGRETLQEIISFRPQQKAVIASGYSQEADVRLAVGLGAGAFIAKPYSIEEIAVALRMALEGENPTT